jgi:hypothetical protein
MNDKLLILGAFSTLTQIRDAKVPTLELLPSYHELIEELRARLAQPEQMPTKIIGPILEDVLNAAGFYKRREWVGLTEDEATILFRLCLGRPYDDFWRAIEAKLKEKNIF